MSEYRGNTYEDIAKVLNEGRDKMVIYRGQMEQLLRLWNDVVEAKNVTVRENWTLLTRLASVQPQTTPTQPGDVMKTKDFAEVIRRKLAADPQLAADVAAETAKVDAFHAHLDQCQRCSDEPMNLCPVGAELLKAVEE